MLKIAFLFLTIGNISHEPVWQRFFQGHEQQHSILVHAKETIEQDSIFKRYEMTTKIPTTWANTMKAQIAMLEQALQDPKNEKFIFLSGDCLPLQKFEYVYQQIMQHPLSIIPYWWNNHQDPDSSYYFAKRTLHGIPADKQFKNSQWVVLNRKHAQMMVDDTSIIDIVSKYPCDNEHYPSTFLAMHNCLKEAVNQQTTFTLWHRGYKHPFTFGNLEDRWQFDTLLEVINQGMLFARKFENNFNEEQFQKMVDKYALKPE